MSEPETVNHKSTNSTLSRISPVLKVAAWKRKLRKTGSSSMNIGKGVNNSSKIPYDDSDIDNALSSTLEDNRSGNWKGSSSRWNYLPPHVFTSTTSPETIISSSSANEPIFQFWRMMNNNNTEKETRVEADQSVKVLYRAGELMKNSSRTGHGEILRGMRRRSAGSSSRRNSSAVTVSAESFSAAPPSGPKLKSMSGIPGKSGGVGDSGISDGGISSSSAIRTFTPSRGPYNRDNNNDIVVGDDVVDIGVSKRLLDIHQISSRLHRFSWEGLGLHHNGTISAGSIGHSITTTIGFNPATAPHTLVFSSLYIVPLILLLGLVVGLIWLLCACTYHTMKRIKFALCPGRSRGASKKGKTSNNAPSSQQCGGGFDDGNKKPAILTPEILEMRRQERLAFLHEECANLEQQLTGLRLATPQSTCDERSATLTSRASDSDLEYLGAQEESPPLKRNSISLQDIPQSVIRIRREKELRQIKEEIEYLRSIAQQEKEKAAQAAKLLKGSFLMTQDFELPGSKPGSPNETKVEPLSQHISHLKTQRKLNEIRTELEDLAIQLLHADELKAKRSSLQDLPRTAINIQREQNLISMSNEIQKKNYKLQQRNVIETALEKTIVNPKGASNDALGKQAGSKSFNSDRKSPSTKEDLAKYSDPAFTRSASIRRQREQELNRVRVELKDLAYKLNLNPMNYISEDRVRLVPSQSMQSTSSGSGQSGYNKSSSSALNHV